MAIGIVITIFSIVCLIISYSKINKTEKEIKKLKDKNDKLNFYNEEVKNENKNLKSTNENLKLTNENLKLNNYKYEEKMNYFSSKNEENLIIIKENQENIKNLEKILQQKEKELIKIKTEQENCDKLKEEINQLNNFINENNLSTERNKGLQEKNQLLVEQFEKNKEKIIEEDNELNHKRKLADEMIDRRDAARLEKENIEKEIKELQRQIAELKKEANDWKEIYRSQRNLEDENRARLVVGEREKKLIEQLKEIKEMYPDLAVDLSKIEWSKVWLPKVQEMCGKLGLDGKVSGIYKLVLIEDSKKCYIGQATDIKDRWYQHIKKMIGADKKGNEKLYEYGPQDFEWTVMTEIKGNLDIVEKELIESLGCKEWGLNKKV